MFDIGFSEVIVIALVALMVLGPERLPKVARFAGLWVRRARAQWYSVKAELENELADDELRRSLQQARSDLEQARTELARTGADLQHEVTQAQDDIERSIGDRDRRVSGAPKAPADDGDAPALPPESQEGTLPHDDGRTPHA